MTDRQTQTDRHLLQLRQGICVQQIVPFTNAINTQYSVAERRDIPCMQILRWKAFRSPPCGWLSGRWSHFYARCMWRVTWPTYYLVASTGVQTIVAGLHISLSNQACTLVNVSIGFCAVWRPNNKRHIWISTAAYIQTCGPSRFIHIPLRTVHFPNKLRELAFPTWLLSVQLLCMTLIFAASVNSFTQSGCSCCFCLLDVFAA